MGYHFIYGQAGMNYLNVLINLAIITALALLLPFVVAIYFVIILLMLINTIISLIGRGFFMIGTTVPIPVVKNILVVIAQNVLVPISKYLFLAGTLLNTVNSTILSIAIGQINDEKIKADRIKTKETEQDEAAKFNESAAENAAKWTQMQLEAAQKRNERANAREEETSEKRRQVNANQQEAFRARQTAAG